MGIEESQSLGVRSLLTVMEATDKIQAENVQEVYYEAVKSDGRKL